MRRMNAQKLDSRSTLNEDHIQKCCYLFLTIKSCFLLLVVLFKKMVKKLLRKFEYSKPPETKKLSVLGPDLSFL